MLNWLFLDMDSYFASVEQQYRPELRDKPVGIVPLDTEYTCCIAASSQAKKLGIKTGTSVKEAKALYPPIKLVTARPAFYVKVHHNLIRTIEQHAPIEKVYSIDEVAIRLLGQQREPLEALALAERIKQGLRRDVGRYITASIGIAPTRLLAKTACEMIKPDGITYLAMDQLPDRLENLSLEKLSGIGTGILARLKQNNVTTVRQLWDLSLARTRQIWGGVQGEHWWHQFHGNDLPEPPTRRRCMGHANVLEPRFRDSKGAHAMMIRLLHKAASRLRHEGFWATRLQVEVTSEEHLRWVEEIHLPTCQDTLTILEHFERLWQHRGQAFVSAHRPKHVGVNLGGLLSQSAHTDSLFSDMRNRANLSTTMDQLNRRWGSHTLYFGGMHDCRHAMDDKIAFGRIPDESSGM